MLRLFRGFRRRKTSTGNPTWQDSMPARLADDSGDHRYLQLIEIDRWRAIPFDMPPSPDRGTARERVRQFVEGLAGCLDEGTAAALDPMIESWVAAWIETVRTESIDHQAVVSVHLGQALQYQQELALTLQHEEQELARLQDLYDESRARLLGTQTTGNGPALSAVPSGGS